MINWCHFGFYEYCEKGMQMDKKIKAIEKTNDKEKSQLKSLLKADKKQDKKLDKMKKGKC